MAKIEQLFELQAKFDPLVQAERKLDKLVASTDRQIAAEEKLAASGDALAASLAGTESKITGASSRMAQMSDATKWLVDQLGVYQEAVNTAFTDSQKDKAIENLLGKMDRMGLAFTSNAAEIERSDLVARMSLEELAKSGDVAANSLARVQFNNRVAEEVESAAQSMASEEKAAQRLSEQLDAVAYKIEKLGVSSMGPEKLGVEIDNLQRKLEKLGQGPGVSSKNASQIEKLQEEMRKLGGETKNTESRAKKALSAFMNFGKVSNPIDKLSNRLTRTVVTLFSVRRVLRYITDAMERAPDSISNSFSSLGNNIKDSFAMITVSAMGGMQRGVDKLNKALNSKAGQTFFRGLERAAELAGNVVGVLLEKGADLVEFLGNHAQEAFTVAAIAAAFFAAQMLLSAGASAAAAWPLLLIVGLAALLVVGLEKLGVTSDQIFYGIGATAGWLYAFLYNMVADIWNVIATFAEFFANVFNDPVAAVAHLFFDTFDVILSMVETAAKAIDFLTGSELEKGVSGFRSGLQSWVDQTFGKNEITIDRMKKISYLGTADAWGNKASDIASSFSLDSLGKLTAPEIKAIKSDTSDIRKAVSLSKEDLKSLVDIAERRFVNQVNLTSLQPIINIKGANTGSTERDRLALANAIKEVLIEQISSSSTVSTVIP